MPGTGARAPPLIHRLVSYGGQREGDGHPYRGHALLTPRPPISGKGPPSPAAVASRTGGQREGDGHPYRGHALPTRALGARARRARQVSGEASITEVLAIAFLSTYAYWTAFLRRARNSHARARLLEYDPQARAPRARAGAPLWRGVVVGQELPALLSNVQELPALLSNAQSRRPTTAALPSSASPARSHGTGWPRHRRMQRRRPMAPRIAWTGQDGIA